LTIFQPSLVLFFARKHLLEIIGHRRNYLQRFAAKHIKKFVFVRVEKLSLDLQLPKQNPVYDWLSVDDISQDWVADARGMDSDLMHLSGFDFYFDQGDFSQDRMIHRFFISTLGDGSLAKSFIHYRLSSLKFFIERFF